MRFGLEFAVYDPRSANLPFGNGTYYWVALLGWRRRHVVLDRSGERSGVRRADSKPGRQPLSQGQAGWEIQLMDTGGEFFAWRFPLKGGALAEAAAQYARLTREGWGVPVTRATD